MILEKKDYISDLKSGSKTIDGLNKLEIVTNLFNKFTSSRELENYLKVNGITLDALRVKS